MVGEYVQLILLTNIHAPILMNIMRCFEIPNAPYSIDSVVTIPGHTVSH